MSGNRSQKTDEKSSVQKASFEFFDGSTRITSSSESSAYAATIAHQHLKTKRLTLVFSFLLVSLSLILVAVSPSSKDTLTRYAFEALGASGGAFGLRKIIRSLKGR